MRRREKEITIEIDQVLSVKRRRPSETDWCSGCGAPVLMLTPDEATTICGKSTREIFRRLDSGAIHFAESRNGLVRFCLPSLVAAAGITVGHDLAALVRPPEPRRDSD